MKRRNKTPVILQTEASECGLACLTMIAQFYGHDIDLPSLRRRHLVSLTGASLGSLIDIAATLDLAPRALSLDTEHLPKLALPAVLHWDFNHYVVLTALGKNHAVIHDPGTGARRVNMGELSDKFTGVALELSPLASFTPQTARLKSHLSMLWDTLVGLKRALAQTLVLSIILQLIVLASPFFLQLVVDGVLPHDNKGLLLALALGFGGLAILRAVTEAVRSWAILRYGNQMSVQMVGNVFHHLMALPVSFFEKRHIGDIISRMNSTQPLQQALTQTVVSTLIDGVMASLMLLIMFIYSPVMAGVVLATVALLAGVTYLLYPRLRRTQEETLLARAKENSHTIETLRASTTLKLFGREAEREAAWRNLYTEAVNAGLEHGRWGVWQRFAESLIGGVQLIIIVYLGASLILNSGTGLILNQAAGNSHFTVGMLFAFLAYRAGFSQSVTQLIRKGVEFSLLGLHLERLSDIVFAQKEDGLGEDGLEESGLDEGESLGEIKGEITLDDVWFRYSDTDPWVIEGLSLTFKAGEMSVITGASGGGKTTLMKLILGLYSPTKGRVLIDGRALSTLSLRHWRRALGVVMQDDQLLSGTIAQNISLFDPDADRARIIKAAQTAQIDDEINAVPMGYDSLIGNMGSVLSGGQKQRVLLARALYHQPKILFLDEGTANLDLKTEAQIVKIIKDMPKTRIIIAHRAAFLNAADNVITL